MYCCFGFIDDYRGRIKTKQHFVSTDKVDFNSTVASRDIQVDICISFRDKNKTEKNSRFFNLKI